MQEGEVPKGRLTFPAGPFFASQEIRPDRLVASHSVEMADTGGVKGLRRIKEGLGRIASRFDQPPVMRAELFPGIPAYPGRKQGSPMLFFIGYGFAVAGVACAQKEEALHSRSPWFRQVDSAQSASCQIKEG